MSSRNEPTPRTPPLPTSPAETRPRRSPWPLAIVIGLVLVAIVQVLFIYIAVRGQDPVAESYTTTAR